MEFIKIKKTSQKRQRSYRQRTPDRHSLRRRRENHQSARRRRHRQRAECRTLQSFTP